MQKCGLEQVKMAVCVKKHFKSFLIAQLSSAGKMITRGLYR